MATKKKNNPASTLPLLIGAICFGIGAALMGYLYLKAKEAALEEELRGKEQQMVTVIVARRNLGRGSVITPENFAARSIPRDYAHGDSLTPPEFERFIGRSITVALGGGKPLLRSFLDSDFPLDFSDTLDVGRRAMTIPVDELNSISGFMRPGNRIDVFVNIAYQGNAGFDPALYAFGLYSELPEGINIDGLGASGVANLINMIPEDQLSTVMSSLLPGDVIIPVLQNAKVIATGLDPYIEALDQLRQPQRRSNNNFSSITLDVSPAEAALLTAAQDKGDIITILRNRNDEGAADFSSISSRDLFTNASKMAAQQAEMDTRASVAAGVDPFGNLVDADGNTILSEEQLAAAGYTVNENGQIVDKDGNVIDPADIVVSSDGTVMTKQQLAAAGLTVNENGQIVDSSGNVVNANDIVVTADGTVLTHEQLAAAGLSVNANGEIVDANGKVVDPDSIIIASDGTVMTSDALAAAGLTTASGVDTSGNLTDASGNVIASRAQLEAAGYTINENDQIVDADGNIVDPADLVVDANGNVMSTDDVMVAADGTVLSREQLAAAGLTINENGDIVDADGNVIDPKDIVVTSDGKLVSKQQLAEQGLSVNEFGEIVDSNGNVIDTDDLITTADGTVMSRSQLEAAGYSVNEKGEIVDADGNVLSSDEVANLASNMSLSGSGLGSGTYNLIIGGSSEDGVPKSTTVPITQ